MDSKTKVLAAGAAGLAAGLVVERLRRKQKDVTGRHDARVIVVLGAQWGDEGKGKLVDVLAGPRRRRRAVQRRRERQGTAGRRRQDLRVPPAAVRHAAGGLRTPSGTASSCTRRRSSRSCGSSTTARTPLERLVVSSRAHVLLDAHRVIDGMIEDEKRGRSTGSLGTTSAASGRPTPRR